MVKSVITINIDPEIKEWCKKSNINFSQTCNEILTQKLEGKLQWYKEMMTWILGRCHCCKTTRSDIFVIDITTKNIFDRKILFGKLTGAPIIQLLFCQECIQKPLKELMEKTHPNKDCSFINVPDTALEYFTTWSQRKKTGGVYGGVPKDCWMFPLDEYLLECMRLKLKIKDNDEEEGFKWLDKQAKKFKEYTCPTIQTNS